MTSNLTSSSWLRAGLALLFVGTAGLLLYCSEDRSPEPERSAWHSASVTEPAKIPVGEGEPTDAAWAIHDQEAWCATIVTDGSEDRLLLIGSSPKGNTRHLLASGGRYLSPAIVGTGPGEVTVVWAADVDDGSWELFIRRLTRGHLSSARQLTQDGEADGWPQLAYDPENERLWMAWHASSNGEWGIELAQVTDQRLAQRKRLTPPGSHAFAPDVVVLADGRAIVAWDAFVATAEGGRDFEVRLWAPSESGAEKILAVTDRPGYDARPDLAADVQGGAWIAWHADDGDWGRERVLNQNRRIELAYYRDGRLGRAGSDPVGAMPEPLGQLASNPQIAADARGGLHLMFTGLTIPQQAQAQHFQGLGENYKAAVWELFTLRYFMGGSWHSLEKLPASAGGARARGELVSGPDHELLMGWISDGRRRALEAGRDFDQRRPASARPELRVSRLWQISVGPPFPTSLEAPLIVDEVAAAVLPTRATLQHDGETYQLVFADLHRHTDISRCASRTDGSLLEAYRYALGPGELDVLCTTDHVTDTREAGWWEIQKHADYFDRPGHFVGLYGYERAEGSADGHKNLFFRERLAPQILPEEARTPGDLWKQLASIDAFGIPHMLASRGHATDWSTFDGRFEPVVEIYQGVRGSYESPDGPRRAPDAVVSGAFAQDALAGGLQFGFVAASDHDSVAESYAGLWVKEVSRDGVFEAIRARRCFAASSPIVLDFRVNGVLSGGEVTLTEAPEITVSVRGMAPIDRIEIIADGEVVETGEGEKKQAKLSFRDQGFAGRTYYYARIIQKDGQVGWASPVFVQ